MAKKELTITEFRAIIREEAIKLKKRIVLENEKKALKEELKSLLGESYMEECGQGEYGKEYMENPSMDEGLFGGPKSYRKKFVAYAQKYGLKPTEEELQALTQQMVDDKGAGFPGRQKVQGIVKMIYKPGSSVTVAPHGAGNIAKWGE